MSPGQRQTVLKLLLPALVIGIGYVYLVARPLNAKITALRDSIAEAEKSAPKPLAEGQQLAKLKDVRAEIARLHAAQKIVADPAKAPDVDRAEYGKRLSAALARHRLTLIDESAEKSPGPLPPGLDASKVDGGARSIRISGRYMDVLEALKELDGPDHRALPLRVTMSRAADGTKVLNWTIVIWL